MSTLLDIAPRFETVSLGQTSLEVYGLGASSIATILFRFPELKDLFDKGLDGLDGETIARIGEEAVGAIIAAGCRMLGNPKAEAVARSLPVGDQVAILKAVYDITFPKGVADFLTSLGLTAPEAANDEAVPALS